MYCCVGISGQISLLILSMLRLLLFKAQELKNVRKSSKPYHLGIHWKALIEYSDEYPFAMASVIFFTSVSSNLKNIPTQN